MSITVRAETQPIPLCYTGSHVSTLLRLVFMLVQQASILMYSRQRQAPHAGEHLQASMKVFF